MSKKTNSLFAVLLSFVPFLCLAQPDADKIKEYLHTSKFDIDTEASAVILYESIHLDITAELGIARETQEIHQFVKILRKSALKQANVKLRLHGNDDVFVKKIRGTTYNLEGNDVKETSLPKSDQYKTELSKNYKEVGFTMPEVKEGSIIEYSMIIVSPINNLSPEWRIQDEEPKLFCQFSVSYPAMLTFTAVIHVKPTLKDIGSEEEAINSGDEFCHYIHNSRSSNGDNYSFWVRKNVPAVKKEPYVHNVSNHMERLQLQLSKAGNAGWERFVTTWDTYNTNFWNSEQAKNIRKQNNFLNDTVLKIIGTNTKKMTVAKDIFNYVRSNYTVNNKSGNSNVDLETVFTKREGSEAAINDLLAAMMNKAGLNTYLLLLSTTDHPSATASFSLLNSFNYVACAWAMDSSGNYLLLDATDKNNIFGILPLHCYNGYSRVISEDGDGLQLSPSVIEDRTASTIKISFPNDSTQQVEICRKLGLIVSRSMRQKMADEKFNRESYCEKYISKLADEPKIIESSFDNVDNPDTNLVIKIVFQSKIDPTAHSLFYNTSFVKTYYTNPFAATTREFPIDFSHRFNEASHVSIELPNGYEVGASPQPKMINLGENEMTYQKLVNYLPDSRLLKIDIINKNDRTSYPSDRYDAIRQYHEAVIKEENTVIEIKRK